MAKAMGGQVTAVCSAGKMDMIKSLGADRVIDYTSQDFSDTEDKFDLVLAVNGSHSVFKYKSVLAPKGHYVMIGGSNKQMFEPMILKPFIEGKDGQQFTILSAKTNPEDLTYVKGLIEEGCVRPTLDGEYTLEQLPEAMRYLESGHVRGKIVINI